jgi:N-formylglutamate deformylase
MQVRRLIQGSTPLLISIPHMGVHLPPDLKRRMTPAALRLPDTDWHLDRLYDFAPALGVGVLMSSHSRYVVDLNRAAEDTDLYPGQVKTGLCPLQTFDGEDIYIDGDAPDAIENLNRVTAYWMPYHDALRAELNRLKAEFGYAILYDAHSIKSRVPRLFDGELPDINIGTVNGASCAAGMQTAAMAAAQDKGFSSVLNGRFVGGYITRNYGRPQDHVHAMQMELSCKNYMNENGLRDYNDTRAPALQAVLRDVLQAILDWGRAFYSNGL